MATILGYSNTRDALGKHVDIEDKNTVAIHDRTTGNPNVIFINEGGLYSLLFPMQPQNANGNGVSDVYPTHNESC